MTSRLRAAPLLAVGSACGKDASGRSDYAGLRSAF